MKRMKKTLVTNENCREYLQALIDNDKNFRFMKSDCLNMPFKDACRANSVTYACGDVRISVASCLEDTKKSRAAVS